MEFRNLHGFNLAMLGKLGWQFTTYNDATMTKIFKAKYCPNGDFLDAQLGHSPSYVWHSIHASQVLVRKGFQWRLDDGEKINIRSQPWLQAPTNYFVTTVAPWGLEDLNVSTLINHHEASWNINIIQWSRYSICASYECWKPNGKFWRFPNEGVKSTYHHLMENKLPRNELKVQGNWPLLWKIGIPSEYKHFLWRLLRDCLPTKHCLQSQGVQCSPLCANFNSNI